MLAGRFGRYLNNCRSVLILNVIAPAALRSLSVERGLGNTGHERHDHAAREAGYQLLLRTI